MGVTPLLTTLMLASAGGTAVSALSSVQAARFNKDVANRNAALAEQKGQIESAAFRRQTRAEQGKRIANIAASGLSFEGSPLDILATSAEQDEFDALQIERGASNQAAGFRTQASFQGRRATGAAMGGAFGVGTSILSSRAKRNEAVA